MLANTKGIADETPPCPTCGAMMDYEEIWDFASKHICSGVLLYCNNPTYAPNEEEQREINLKINTN